MFTHVIAMTACIGPLVKIKPDNFIRILTVYVFSRLGHVKVASTFLFRELLALLIP